jgi:CubicO group peptidase (beta-lactamase class C family)
MKKFISLLCLNFILILAVKTNAQSIKKLDDSTVTLLNQTIQAIFNGNNLTGLSVGILYGGEVVYTNAWGTAKPGTPFTVGTKSLLASVSKTITGMMAMKMVENGVLGLDVTINNYISGYNGTSITIRHLLSHQSGIAHYGNCPPGYNGAFNAAQSLSVVQGCMMCMLPPGSGNLYTTFGTTLLGVIIQNVGLLIYGKSYTQLYADWILNPAGLFNLTAEFDNSDPVLAAPYSAGGVWQPGFWSDIGWKLPAGGFISDITDLAKYSRGIMRNTFITQNTFTQMQQVQSTTGSPVFLCDQSTSGVGLGFFINSSGDDLRINHSGANDHGYSSLLYLYPSKGAGIVLLNNNDNAGSALSAIRNQVESLILCPETRNFRTNINWTTPFIYEAQDAILASSQINATSGVVIFDAGNSITLKPGFLAQAGLSFRATIEGCGGIIKPF